MSLMMGTGPFGPQRDGTFNFDTSVLQPHTLYLEDCPKRVRAEFAGEMIVDSQRVKILRETGHLPRYYLPCDDVRADLLQATEDSMRLTESDTETVCPFKGRASHWSVHVHGERVVEAAVWGHPEPLPEATSVRGYYGFYPDKVTVEVDGQRL